MKKDFEKLNKAKELPVEEAVLPQKTSEIPPKSERLDPTRYGDWEKNGKCIDF